MLHAVAIGISRHADSKIRDLEFAAADAQAVASALDERVDGDRQLTVLVDERATKARIARVLTEELPCRIRHEDAVLLYFAGYGSPEVEASNAEPSIHLVAHDTSYAQLYATSINLVSELSAWTRRLQARVVLVVLDASFNGAAGGRTFEGPGLWSGPRLRRLDRLSLGRLSLGSHAALLTACGEKEVAREDAELRHGVFTHFLVEALRGPRVADEPITVTDLHLAVAATVRDATGGEQNPVLYGRPWGGPLFRIPRGVHRFASAS